MKKLAGIFGLFAIVILTACEGPVGPPGYDGVDGDDGIDAEIGTVIEITGDFNADNNYELYYEFPSNVEIYESDVVMIYILWEQADATNGGLVDVWRPLPQTIVLNEGILQYNYDYTVADVKVFLDGDIDFGTLLPAEKDDQVFRIAILPAAFAQNNSFDISNMNSLLKGLKIDNTSITRAEF